MLKLELQDKAITNKRKQLKNSAKKRGIFFNLSREDVKWILEQEKCFYTGVKFKPNSKQARSIDRIDSNDGYTRNNIVVCTKRINELKSNLSYKEISQLYWRIKYIKLLKFLRLW